MHAMILQAYGMWPGGGGGGREFMFLIVSSFVLFKCVYKEKQVSSFNSAS